MNEGFKFRPSIAIALLVATSVFIALVTLFYYGLACEEYRRFASNHMPDGSHIAWQQYEGYPTHWGAVMHVVVQMRVAWLALIGVWLFLARLLILSIRARSRKHQLCTPWRFINIFLGVVAAVLCFAIACDVRNEWLAPWPVRELGFVASATFFLVPIWMLATRISSTQPNSNQRGPTQEERVRTRKF